MSTSKGQVGTEFFLYSAIFLILVIAVASIVSFNQSQEITSLEYSVAEESGEKFADAFNLVAKGEKGISYNLTYTKTILGADYTISFSEDRNFLILEWQGSSGTLSSIYPIIPYEHDYEGCISEKNKVILSSVGDGKITLANKGEEILIEQKGCT